MSEACITGAAGVQRGAAARANAHGADRAHSAGGPCASSFRVRLQEACARAGWQHGQSQRLRAHHALQQVCQSIMYLWRRRVCGLSLRLLWRSSSRHAGSSMRTDSQSGVLQRTKALALPRGLNSTAPVAVGMHLRSTLACTRLSVFTSVTQVQNKGTCTLRL